MYEITKADLFACPKCKQKPAVAFVIMVGEARVKFSCACMSEETSINFSDLDFYLPNQLMQMRQKTAKSWNQRILRERYRLSGSVMRNTAPPNSARRQEIEDRIRVASATQ